MVTPAAEREAIAHLKSDHEMSERRACIRWPASVVYNAERHDGIANLTPADVYFGRAQAILKTREKIKHQHLKTDASITTGRLLEMKNQMRQILHSIRPQEVHIYLTTDRQSPMLSCTYSP